MPGKTTTTQQLDHNFSHRQGERHNIFAPIARKHGDTYILDIIFRNNRVSEEYPDGIFHAHKQYHNIKSEGIGLIEAMGLFVLPARLDRQLKEVEGYLCGEPYDRTSLASDMRIHGDMIEQTACRQRQFQYCPNTPRPS